MEDADGKGAYAQFDRMGRRLRTINLSPSATLASVGQNIAVGLSFPNEDEEGFTRLYRVKATAPTTGSLGWCGRSSTF